MSSQTKVDVVPRDVEFNFDEVQDKWWWAGNKIMTAYAVALFAQFPAGEAQFVSSVKHYAGRVTDPKLKAEVDSFISQELEHGNQHQQANKAMDRVGLFGTLMHERTVKDIVRFRKMCPKPEAQLASTVGLEHLTAVLADYVLRRPQLFDDGPDVMHQLMMWHAVEEIEHKSVAFDVYMACVGDRRLLQKMQRKNVRALTINTLRHMSKIFWKARAFPTFSDVRGAWRFFFGKDGLVPATKQAMKDYYRDDFHPWQHDNRDLLAEWQQLNESQVLAA